jgi:hypothetical protein
VGSPWVLDADGWLIRIALHGIAGPLRVADEDFDLVMPGFASDPRFTDDALAGLLTHVRRAWGNAADPIAPDAVAYRAQHSETRRGLEGGPAARASGLHRLDRRAGRYASS